MGVVYRGLTIHLISMSRRHRQFSSKAALLVQIERDTHWKTNRQAGMSRRSGALAGYTYSDGTFSRKDKDHGGVRTEAGPHTWQSATYRAARAAPGPDDTRRGIAAISERPLQPG